MFNPWYLPPRTNNESEVGMDFPFSFPSFIGFREYNWMEHGWLKVEYLSFWSGDVFDVSSPNFMIFVSPHFKVALGASNFTPGYIALLILTLAQQFINHSDGHQSMLSHLLLTTTSPLGISTRLNYIHSTNYMVCHVYLSQYLSLICIDCWWSCLTACHPKLESKLRQLSISLQSRKWRGEASLILR